MTIHRKVKRVIDGDTFEVSRKIQGTDRIRMAELNAPETYQFGGERATEKLKRQIHGKTVTLQPVARSYGRIVAKVRVRGRLIK